MTCSPTGIVQIEFNGEDHEIFLSPQSNMATRIAMNAEIHSNFLIPTITLDIKQLTEGIKALPSQEVVIKVNGSTQPVVIQSLGKLHMKYLMVPKTFNRTPMVDEP